MVVTVVVVMVEVVEVDVVDVVVVVVVENAAVRTTQRGSSKQPVA